MALDLIELKKKHDKAFIAGQITRERASSDIVFYWLTQWDDRLLNESQLGYRGEFNILRKAGRQILSDLSENPVQTDFEPVGETGEDAAESLDGIYRTDDAQNYSIEAYEVGSQESVVCGFGAWELYTEYASSLSSNQDQVIRRRPINEANNVVFFDPDSKSLDKSDAEYCSVLVPYTKEGYQKLVKDLTGTDEEVDEGSFKSPEHSYVFPWVTSSQKILWIANFYHREKIKATVYNLVDPYGEITQMWDDDLEEDMDGLIEDGFTIESSKEIERWEVTKYIASGKSILSKEIISGQHIPIIPMYGEHAYVEGEEHWEGITRLAKDPSRLRNFMMSYIADIASRSPRPKAIFFSEQIKGFEFMYEESGADNMYPYYLQNRKAKDGTELPVGPIATMPEQKVPEALAEMLVLTREAVEDVANPGLPQDIADPDVSGKAVLALQARLDRQSQIYQQHLKHAKRRDGVVYASIASDIYDVPRRVKTTLPDGTRQDRQLMEQVVDENTGDISTINDLHNAEFEVYTTIGEHHSTKKEKDIENYTQLYQNTSSEDPMKRVLLLKVTELMSTDNSEIKEYARKELILLGVKKPETEEEKQMLKEAQEKGPEPSAEMVLAQAEVLKGEADKMEAELKQIKIQLDDQNEKMKRSIDMFEAQTDRFEAQIAAADAEVTIDYKRSDKFGKDIENMINLRQLHLMSDKQLLEKLGNNAETNS
jgi:hypothetical protein